MAMAEEETRTIQNAEPPESREEMLSRHQKEIKELRNKETEQKKGAAKGSKAEQKAKKKAIEEEITRLDQEMKSRHSKELASLGFTSEPGVDALVRAIAGVSVTQAPATSKPSKGQKWRDRRAKQDAEREQRIQQEQADMVSSRVMEEESLMKKLEPLGFSLREMKPDGHCLYRAIADQLTLDPSAEARSFQELRGIAASYIRSNAEFFAPFIEGSGSEVEEYCSELESTAAWGGQLELQALAHALKRHIFVFSADMGDVEMGVEYRGSPSLRLSYHKHAFGLGEHYNSVVPA